jgi:hypothetical protein
MKIMLSSFDITSRYSNSSMLLNSNRPPEQFQRGPAVFSRLPPMDMHNSTRGLALEYSLLILCDKVLVDASSIERLQRDPNPALGQVAKTIELLRGEGLLEVVDYDTILDKNRLLLKRMTENDLGSVDQWINTLLNSGRMWSRFATSVGPSIGLELPPTRAGSHIHLGAHGAIFDDHVEQILKAEESAPLIREMLESYLTYVNANLILSNETEAGLHDWADFAPFYQRKFLTVGRADTPGSAEAEASRQLFSIAFPEFVIESPEQLIRLLKDRRVGELRSLISEASTGAVVFDEAFARSVFHEVFGIERKLAKQRRLLGYLSLPVSFIPFVGTFAQLLVQEAAGSVLERRLTKPYRWFYMLSDLGQDDRGLLPGRRIPIEDDKS